VQALLTGSSIEFVERFIGGLEEHVGAVFDVGWYSEFVEGECAEEAVGSSYFVVEEFCADGSGGCDCADGCEEGVF